MKGWMTALALAMALSLAGCGSRGDMVRPDNTTGTNTDRTVTGMEDNAANRDTTATDAQRAADRNETQRMDGGIPATDDSADARYYANENGRVEDGTYRDRNTVNDNRAEGAVDRAADAVEDVTDGIINGTERVADGVIDGAETAMDGTDTRPATNR